MQLVQALVKPRSRLNIYGSSTLNLIPNFLVNKLAELTNDNQTAEGARGMKDVRITLDKEGFIKMNLRLVIGWRIQHDAELGQFRIKPRIDPNLKLRLIFYVNFLYVQPFAYLQKYKVYKFYMPFEHLN